jgi:hypothetical protein
MQIKTNHFLFMHVGSCARDNALAMQSTAEHYTPEQKYPFAISQVVASLFAIELRI